MSQERQEARSAVSLRGGTRKLRCYTRYLCPVLLSIHFQMYYNQAFEPRCVALLRGRAVQGRQSQATGETNSTCDALHNPLLAETSI